MEDKFKPIYTGPADQGSLGTIDCIQRSAKKLRMLKVNRRVVKQLLKKEQAYTLHRQARRRYVRNRKYVLRGQN